MSDLSPTSSTHTTPAGEQQTVLPVLTWQWKSDEGVEWLPCSQEWAEDMLRAMTPGFMFRRLCEHTIATKALQEAAAKIEVLERDLDTYQTTNARMREERAAAEARIAVLTKERDEAQMDASIAGTETDQYWRGQDDGCRGTMARWQQALEDPLIPAIGVIGDERMESLYRKTESIRARIAVLEADARRWQGFVAVCIGGDQSDSREHEICLTPSGYNGCNWHRAELVWAAPKGSHVTPESMNAAIDAALAHPAVP